MAYTGYRINTYIDVNPNSSTFQDTRTERVQDIDCLPEGEEWVILSETCEFINSTPTGYVIKTTFNVNIHSSNYGEKRIEKIYDTDKCPLANTNPNWVVDPNFAGYCELMWYEPGHVQEQSGRYVVQLIDDNMYSQTAGQTVISAYTDTQRCVVPNTSPMFEDFTGYCELDSEGKNTGIYVVTALDKNVFSPTYLTVVTERYQDEVNCPTHEFSCADYGFFDEGAVVASSGGTFRLGTYVNSGDLILTPVSYPSWMFDFGESVLAGRRAKSLHCTCGPNDSGAQRTGTVVFSGSSGDCSFSATVIQNYDEPVFDCSAYGFNNESSVVPASGGTFRLGTYVNSGDLILTPVSYPDWLSDFGESVLAGRRSKSLRCTCAANETGSDRQGTVVFSGTSGDCQFTATFIQYAEAPTPPPTPSFSCNDYYFTPSLSTVDASGGTNIIVADYVDSQSLSLSVSSKPAWVTNPSEGIFIGHSMRSLVVDVIENTGETRTGTIVYSGNSGDCSFSVTITQSGETTQACNDYNFSDSGLGDVDASGATDVLFANYNNTAALVVSSCPSWITDLNPSAVDGGYYAVSGNVSSNTGSTRTGTIYLVPADGGDCEFTVSVTQSGDASSCLAYQVEDYDPWIDMQAQDVAVGESSKEFNELSVGSVSANWITDVWVDDETSDTKYKYWISCQDNTTGQDRTAEIILNNGDCEFTLNVTQTGT